MPEREFVPSRVGLHPVNMHRVGLECVDGTGCVSCSDVPGAFAPCQPAEGDGLKSGELQSGIHIPGLSSDELLARVRRELTPPPHIDLRMAGETG